MHVFFVSVKIKTPAGELSTPMGWTEHQETAVMAAQRLRDMLQLVFDEPVGPERVPLRAVFGALGIQAVHVAPMGAEVSGLIETPPERKIIL